ncbi:ChaN family lipoprotein [Roseovarius indicus]|uniref:ChaN family lipoprotein n=1 Tax=Roseovarius indicus TaxID=540747 RepID=UPI001F2E9398|nr:ChaN family lipoprotein [Roseovarius indicus]
MFSTLSCAATAQDVSVLGEVHDNPAHHAAQAERVQNIAPRALVFEMLTPEQANSITPELRGDADALAKALDWENSGWPDFAMYYPIFAAAPDARIYGAGVGRDEARAAMDGGFDGPMDGNAARFGLDEPLPQHQQDAREALQMEAHCNAIPEEMLPGMVRIQRLRDAMLARMALEAHEETGGPVVVITGNGHARRDWGMPALLALAAPELEVHVVGQTENEMPLVGGFDEVLSAPPAQRDDPCEAFR